MNDDNLSQKFSLYSGQPMLAYLAYCLLPVGILSLVVFWMGELMRWNSTQPAGSWDFLKQTGISYTIAGSLCLVGCLITRTHRWSAEVNSEEMALYPIRFGRRKVAYETKFSRERLTLSRGIPTFELTLGSKKFKVVRHGRGVLKSTGWI